MGVHWHPECSDDMPVRSQSLTQSCENRSYNKYCYEEFYYPRRDICKHFIPTNEAGIVEYNAHPFWEQKYCPSHEQDCTAICCSCERMEQLDAKYLALDDGRKLCPDCLDSATMKTQDCQPLCHEMQ